ncbi:MAG: hypothetical protein R6V85_06855 [Polyangia bacterium]
MISRFTRWTIASLLVSFSLAVAIDSGAARKRRGSGADGLVTATVHVLDAGGGPAGGVEVELIVIRADGTRDRRIALSAADGRASFPDVRSDCSEIRAAAELEDGTRVEGEPRSCGQELEAFLVLPPAGEAAPGRAVEEEPQQAPAEEPDPVPTLDEDPYDFPISEPADEDEEEPESPKRLERGLLQWSARGGVGFCQQWFYEPGDEDPDCGEEGVVGLDLEADLGVHVAEWLVVGARLGYRFFSSEVVFQESSQEASSYDPSLNVSGESGEVEAANHRLLYGLLARGVLYVGDWALGLEAVPIGVFHQLTRGKEDQSDDFAEFFVSVGVSAAYRFGRSWWGGLYADFFQPLPWVCSQRFMPGTLTVGLVFGGRFGPPALDEDADG